MLGADDGKEVVERPSSISRVTWSMVGGNAQLGAVDGSAVVLLFPSRPWSR